MSEIEDPTPPVPTPEPVPSPDPVPSPNPGPEPPELTPSAGTPERQQDPGRHGYGGTHQEKDAEEKDEEPGEQTLDDPDAGTSDRDEEREQRDRAR